MSIMAGADIFLSESDDDEDFLPIGELNESSQVFVTRNAYNNTRTRSQQMGTSREENGSHSQAKRPRITDTGSSEPCSSQNSTLSWQETMSSMTERIKYSLNNPQMSDIIFLCGSERIEVYAHKTLLCFSSPVFQAQFMGSLSTNNATEEVPDIEAAVFLNFLSYLYCETFDDNISVKELLDLLYPAKKYLVPSLSRLCCDQLTEKLNAENVFAVYHGASLYDENKLKKSCIKFMERMSDRIIQTEEFTSIDLRMLSIFLALDGLSAPEYDLHRASLRWARAECARRDVESTKEVIREILGPAIYLIRFPTMSSSEFSTEYPESVLTPEESLLLYRQICSEPKWEPEFCQFPGDKRKFEPEIHILNRFANANHTIELHQVSFRNEPLYKLQIEFTTDKRVFMNGVSLFAVEKTHATNACLGFDIYLNVQTAAGQTVEKRVSVNGDLNCGNGRISGCPTITASSSAVQYFPVYLDEPLEIAAKGKVVVYATVKKLDSIKTTLNTYYGSTGLFHVPPTYKITVYCPSDDRSVVFKFNNKDNSELGVYSVGQIPEILFSL